MFKNIKIIILLPLIFLVGCATLESGLEKKKLEGGKQNYNFDLSTTPKTGILLIYAIPPSQQIAINNYGIKIDDRDIITIFKYSSTRIIIDTGSHKLEIFALPKIWKGIYGDVFGKLTTKQILIEESKSVAFEYTGPYWMWAEGKLKEINKD
ncbi:MAG: hypothetical protein HY606_00080 [Planctomycetes bacterium]|nr:hypothetical protein [Planctomycetota bacterium]